MPIGFQQRCGYSTVLVACLDAAPSLPSVFIFECSLLSLQKEWLGDHIVCSAYRMLFKTCATTFPKKCVLMCYALLLEIFSSASVQHLIWVLIFVF